MVVSIFSLTATIVAPGGGEESKPLLKPPGLRLVNEPSTVIPAFHEYPNEDLGLPRYRESSGELSEGWTVKVIKTRRFSGNQSARLYFRISDLARSRAFKDPDGSRQLRIWPSGTFMILEVYNGNGSMARDSKPEEIAVIAKMGRRESHPPSIFYPSDWSYGKFTPEGEPSLLPGQLQECHGCHSIAFHLTGDLVFTQFPRQ